MPFYKKTRSVVLLLGTLAAILALILFYNQRGLFHLKQLQQEMTELKTANRKLEEENRLLLQKIERIKNDPKYIEDEARKKLGLVKPDEQIYRMKEE